MPANRIAEKAGRIFTERPRDASTAMVARHTALPAIRLSVAEVTNISTVKAP